MDAGVLTITTATIEIEEISHKLSQSYSLSNRKNRQAFLSRTIPFQSSNKERKNCASLNGIL
jgi:hypothetical protein